MRGAALTGGGFSTHALVEVAFSTRRHFSDYLGPAVRFTPFVTSCTNSIMRRSAFSPGSRPHGHSSWNT